MATPGCGFSAGPGPRHPANLRSVQVGRADHGELLIVASHGQYRHLPARHGGWADGSTALLGYIEEADRWSDNPVTGL
ncbi:hypothetical protein ABT352_38765 [Streptosporangium sp. NPDC000563]|uniref:hypothetical protein n=1 Tax=Streptosporangium sp. NPDC000563 TaxID=3154366 RepID=UPI00331E0015